MEKKKKREPPSTEQNSVDTEARGIMPVWLKSFLNTGTHLGRNLLLLPSGADLSPTTTVSVCFSPAFPATASG